MTILDSIVERKFPEVEARKKLPKRDSVKRQSLLLSEVLSPCGGPTRLIAEIKRKSPSKGTLNAHLKVADIASTYVEAGAHAISVLTDEEGFGGRLEDLETVAQTVSCPLLRKDFIVDAFQIEEAQRAGAAAVLLIVAALEKSKLVDFLQMSSALQLDAVVEVHDEAELEIALSSGAKIIGINNRNLHSFEVDLAVSERVLPRIPNSVLSVCESGILQSDDIARLRQVGASNFLVGEFLVKSVDITAAVGALVKA